MPGDGQRRTSVFGVLFTVLIVLGVALALVDALARWMTSQAPAALPGVHALGSVLRPYLAARAWVTSRPVASVTLLLLAMFAVGLVLVALKQLAAAMNRWQERFSGMAFANASYDLPRKTFALTDLMARNPAPAEQVVIGFSAERKPVYLTDHARSMHVHVLGQTGSGKTRSVIEPLLFQDLWRGRGVLVVDGKGAQENEERFAAMAAACGRLADVKIFTLNPFRATHTYNPVHLTPSADPKAVAERVFSTFAHDMDVPYYRDQASRFFVNLVCALASTGKRFTLLDIGAAITSRDVLAFALQQSSDRKARRSIEAQLSQLGRKRGETFTGLLAAVQRYDVAAVNAVDPDIVLEEDIEHARAVAFFLPANYYKQLARYLGICVLQHLQQVGSLRQLDRARSQLPLYVYADEFYTFAYEGFTDAVNKLRDANISLLLSHQTMSDLDKVSREFARGIWDNTRNKVVLYQNDPEVCERIAKALGTERGVELTVQRAVDVWMNSISTHVGSSREVDAYRCHPNRIKSLHCGQAYLAQGTDFIGVNLEQLPPLPPASPPPPRSPAEVPALRLHEMFLGARPAGGTSSP